MRNFYKLFLLILPLLFSNPTFAKEIRHQKKASFLVNGNCEMCKSIIESSSSKPSFSKGIWNENTKILSLTWDSSKTSKDEILKNIAYAGYDNELYLAPKEAFARLSSCCQYERTNKKIDPLNQNPEGEDIIKNSSQGKSILPKAELSKPLSMIGMEGMEEKKLSPISNKPNKQEEVKKLVFDQKTMEVVYQQYFQLKDDFVKDNLNMAGKHALTFEKAVKSVDMERMDKDKHQFWMQIVNDLVFDIIHISESKNLGHQRDHFASLSKNMVKVLKVFKTETSIYYQFCPMYNKGKGANWLSKTEEIKNPYFGSSMINCGSTQEIIK